jgi:hypothetical protein
MVKLYQIVKNFWSFLLLLSLTNAFSLDGLAKGIVKKESHLKNQELRKTSRQFSGLEKSENQFTGKVLADDKLDISFNNSDNHFSDLLLTPTVTIWNGSAWDQGEPNQNIDVVIAQNYAGAGFVAKNFTLEPGKSFSAFSSVELFGNGENLSNSSVLATVVLKGSSSQTWKGKIQNLTIDNSVGANLSGQTELTGTLKLQNGPFNTNGNLILVSNSLGTARVATIESGASIIGNATVQRYVSGNQPGWHYVGTPVLGQTQAEWVDDFTITNNFLFLHNEAGTLNVGEQINGWEFVPQNLEVGRGYRAYLNQGFFNNGAVFDNNGSIYTGPKTFNITFTPGGYGGGGWNYIANPYPCEIDWHILNKSSVDGQYHIWNHDVGNYGTYTQGTGLSTFGLGRYIPSGQGFFVKASTAGASLSIDENAKPLVPQANTFVRTNAAEGDVARFTLRAPDGKYDESAVRWMEESTPGFDAYYDANKLYVSAGTNLFSLTSEGIKASIQARPFDQADSITLGFDLSLTGSYFLQIKIGSEIFEGKTWYFKDLATGFSQLIQEDFLFPFQIQESDLNINSRFRLVGSSPVLSTKAGISKDKVEIFPNPTNDKFFVFGASEVSEIQIADLNGKQLKKIVNQENSTIEISTDGLSQGIYILKLISPQGIKTQKLVKN